MRRFNTLVVMQPTEFCNIDCAYCYLPHRSSKARMSPAVLKRTFEEAFTSPLVEPPITFLWHLGEPLAVPISFYEDAFALAAAAAVGSGRTYEHEFQSNGTLLNDGWIEFVRRHNVGVGISVDGPAHVHDRMRRNRQGVGTHAEVMRGIRLLRTAGIPFTTICVLTTYALDRADEMFDFFRDSGITDVGFNIDEMEGVHATSSFQDLADTARYRAFIKRFIERIDESRGAIKLREVWSHLPKILSRKPEAISNSTNKPFHIVNVDVHGGISTFCPELVTASAAGTSFTLGNIAEASLEEVACADRFQEIWREIEAGKDKCRSECSYWSFCGGGSPANKFFEAGRMDVSETLMCRLSIKENVNALVEFLESKSRQAVTAT